jgi:hypothetical protein
MSVLLDLNHLADRLDQAITDARIALMDAFVPDGNFEVDAEGEVIASVNAERAIDRALSELYELQQSLTKKR